VSEPTAAPPSEVDVLDAADAGEKAIRGGGLRVGSYVAGVVIGLISAPLLVRYLSLAEYGLFVTVSSILFIVAGLMEGGIGNVAIRAYSRADAEERARLLRGLLGLRFVMGSAAGVLAVAFTLVAGYPSEVTIGVAIGVAGMLLGAWQHTLGVSLQAELKLGSMAALDLVRQIATTALIALLVIAGAGLIVFFTVSPLAWAVTLAATFAVAGAAARTRPAADVERWIALLKETALYAVATALGIMYFQVAIVTTSLLAGDVEAGYYGASFRVVDIANGVPWLLSAAAFPILARAAHTDAERLRYAAGRLVQTALVVGGLFCVAIAVGAPVALAVIGGSKLDPAIPVLRLLGFGVPFTFLIATWSFTLLSLHRHTALLVANAIAVAAAVTLSVILIPERGADGAAITTVALEVLLASAYGLALGRRDPAMRPDAKGALRVLLALAAALATGFLLPVPAVPATLVALAVYAALVLALRAVPAEIAVALKVKRR
jgi:O-antigen/teichoic acid export membrane protein